MTLDEAITVFHTKYDFESEKDKPIMARIRNIIKSNARLFEDIETLEGRVANDISEALVRHSKYNTKNENYYNCDPHYNLEVSIFDGLCEVIWDGLYFSFNKKTY